MDLMGFGVVSLLSAATHVDTYEIVAVKIVSSSSLACLLFSSIRLDYAASSATSCVKM